MKASCDRARSLLSLALDEPLSELEQRFVDAHTRGCEGCRTFGADAEAFTAVLRATSLEHLPWSSSEPMQLPRRRSSVRGLAQLVSVASVVLAAGTAALTAHPVDGVSEHSVAAPQRPTLLGDESIRSLRRDALADGHLRILPVANTADPHVKPALPAIG